MPTAFDLKVVHPCRCFFNLGPRAVKYYRTRATLIRHWIQALFNRPQKANSWSLQLPTVKPYLIHIDQTGYSTHPCRSPTPKVNGGSLTLPTRTHWIRIHWLDGQQQAAVNNVIPQRFLNLCGYLAGGLLRIFRTGIFFISPNAVLRQWSCALRPMSDGIDCFAHFMVVTAQITRWDRQFAPFVQQLLRNGCSTGTGCCWHNCVEWL